MEKLAYYFVPPSSCVASYRYPYYFRCYNCSCIISGPDPDNLREKIIELDWRYNYKEDILLCPDCYREIVQPSVL